MSIEGRTTVEKTTQATESARAASALADHLRANPQAVCDDPAQLAARFGLSEDMVRHALAAIESPESASGSGNSGNPAFDLSWVGRLYRRGVDVGDRLTARLLPFVAVSFVSLYAIDVVLSLIPFAPRSVELIPTRAVIFLSLLLAVFAVHFACYFRKGMGRYPFYGAGLWLLGYGLPVIVFDPAARLAGAPAGNLAQQVVAFVSIGFMYLVLGFIASTGGALYRVRKARREEKELSRQELIARYLELQERLQRATESPSVSSNGPTFNSEVARRFNRHPLLISLAVGFLLSIPAVLFDVDPTQPDVLSQSAPPWVTLTLFLVSALGTMAAIAVGYLSEMFRRATLAGLLFAVGSFLAYLLPIESFGPHMLGWILSTPVSLFSVLFTLFCAYAGAVAAQIQSQAVRQKRLQENDPAALLAEMVRLQWRLSTGAAKCSVLVLDVAKSTAMKAGADPLLVEFSFRAYQDWVRETCRRRGGRVVSTAGDGVVVAFDVPAQALAAARDLQDDVVRFNAVGNRLALPFRLRAGLHAGDVAGELNEVQFTGVIDVASHIESVAPVGGIAVSGEFADLLPEEEFVPLEESVDGHRVLVAKPKGSPA
ncbi:MAG: adenylate/guanylate cyclase domain-containing protein [Fimbriimonadaceae bacterium]